MERKRVVIDPARVCRGQYSDDHGNRCALGWVLEAHGIDPAFTLSVANRGLIALGLGGVAGLAIADANDRGDLPEAVRLLREAGIDVVIKGEAFSNGQAFVDAMQAIVDGAAVEMERVG